MSVAGSVFSQFKEPGSVLGKRRSMLDNNGYDMPLSYIYKIRLNTPGENLPIVVQVPQQLKPYVNGDKLVHVRFAALYDHTIQAYSPDTQMSIAFRFIVDNQRNNVNKEGIQTQIIGYANWDADKKLNIGECQPFEMDSKVPLKIEVEWNQGGNWQKYILPSPLVNIYPYIYMDIEIHYDYTQQY